jgi:ArsR family transcriptional regulator, arsenate/arsenite/antimonite-responsive transcriptional repressor
MDTKQMAKIFKALSNPNRLELYLKIAQAQEAGFDTGGECTITDIMGCFNIGAPTISHHIKELANANLIITEKRGKFLICKVNKQLTLEVSRLLALPSYD